MARRQDPRVRKIQRMRRAWAKPLSVRGRNARDDGPSRAYIVREQYGLHKFDETTKKYMKGAGERNAREEILSKIANSSEQTNAITFKLDDITSLTFHSENKVWYFVEEHETFNKVSMTYSSKAFAIRDYRRDRITWVKVLPLPPPKSAPPTSTPPKGG